MKRAYLRLCPEKRRKKESVRTKIKNHSLLTLPMPQFKCSQLMIDYTRRKMIPRLTRHPKEHIQLAQGSQLEHGSPKLHPVFL